MPNKTVYISPENEEAWEEFKVIHSSINSFLSSKPYLERALPPPITGMKVAGAGSPQKCKIHDTPLDSRGRCLQKGCKYA